MEARLHRNEAEGPVGGKRVAGSANMLSRCVNYNPYVIDTLFQFQILWILASTKEFKLPTVKKSPLQVETIP